MRYSKIRGESGAPLESVEDEVNASLRDMRQRSSPPSAVEQHIETQLFGVIHRDRMKSGSFLVEELKREMQARMEKETAIRLADEIEKRREAERKLERKEDRIWQVILLCIGILISAGAVGIGIGRATGHEAVQHGE